MWPAANPTGPPSSGLSGWNRRRSPVCRRRRCPLSRPPPLWPKSWTRAAATDCRTGPVAPRRGRHGQRPSRERCAAIPGPAAGHTTRRSPRTRFSSP